MYIKCQKAFGIKCKLKAQLKYVLVKIHTWETYVRKL